MRSRRLTDIYSCKDKYLYEIIEDYKDAQTEEEQNDIFHSFCSSLWNCPNKRRLYKKQIKYSVRGDLKDSELGKIFDTWSSVEYVGYRLMTRETGYTFLILQKINNLYTRYYDKEVILAKEYMDLLRTPKRLYYSWIKGTEYTADYVTNEIDCAIANAIKAKIKYRQQKMDLSWDNYIEDIEGYLRKIFTNCQLLSDYENMTETTVYIDTVTEDNFYIRYFSCCLEGYLKNHQKKYYGLKRNKKYRRCADCGTLFEVKDKDHKSVRCNNCYTVYRKRRKLETQRDRRSNMKSEQ